MKIGFIGLGNMARAIIGGMTTKGGFLPEDICGADVLQNVADDAALTHFISAGTSNSVVAKAADVLVLAVKPQYMESALRTIKDEVKKECIIITIAPGKPIDYYEEAFGRKAKIVRCMPNTPALVGAGCTGYCYNENVTDEDLEIVTRILNSFGKAFEVPEELMDVVVGISGSAPAYVFMFIEALADAGVREGMPRKKAYDFASQAVMGSAKLMVDKGEHPGVLKDMVCSPGGTTIEAVKVLENRAFRGAVMDAVEACVNRSREL